MMEELVILKEITRNEGTALDRVVSGGHSEEVTFKLRTKEKPEVGE